MFDYEEYNTPVYKNDLNKVLPILEVYTCVQGEGSRTGKPTMAIRTTGCTHRCFFGEGGWCDSWYTSIHPEKGIYTLQHIFDAYKKNPQIKEMMLTGGSPTMHQKLVDDLTIFCNTHNIIMTIETEGSHAFETPYPIDMLSISPKFSNSVPVIGTLTPAGKVVDERMVKLHNKHRLKIDTIRELISYHKDYQLKIVVDKDLKAIPEILEFIEELGLGKDNVWLMPAGDSREALMESYGPVMDYCRDEGFNFTGRPHIIAFDTQRYV